MANTGISFAWPQELLDSQRSEIARNTIPLLAEFREWVHRRVETIEFLHETRVHHRISIDFTLPGFDLPRLVTPSKEFVIVPLTLLQKRPLKNFDLRDEYGRALPLLSREENGKIASAVLIDLAEYILGKERRRQKIDEDVSAELTDIAIRSAPQALAALKNLETSQGAGSHQQRTLLWADPDMKVLAGDFARNFILMTLMEGAPGDRRIIKFSYEDTARPIHLSPLQWAGLQSVGYGTRIASLGVARSYHVEIGIPDDLFSVSAGLYPAGSSTPLPDAERSVARVHLYAPGMSRETVGSAETQLRVRSQIVLETFLASAITTAVIGGGVILHWGGVHPSPEVLTVLVVILPGVFAAFLVRPGAHPIVSRLATGLRFEIFVSALLSFIAAGSLAVGFSGKIRFLIWSCLSVASLTLTVVSAIAYRQALWAERHR